MRAFAIATLFSIFVATVAWSATTAATKSLPHAVPHYPRSKMHHTQVRGRDGKAHDVTYHVSRRLAVWQGDMAIPLPRKVKHGKHGILSLALGDVGALWPNHTVNYCLDSNLNANQTTMVNAAIAEWRSKTKIVFHDDGSPCGSAADTAAHEVQLTSWNQTYCLADVGLQETSPQFVRISYSESYCDSGTVIHEIGHAMGLMHEQSRPDRDTYVTIHLENAYPDYRDNFDIYNGGTYVGTSYDCQSIMHYAETTFSMNAKPTIEPNDPATCKIDNQEHLSAGDIAGVKALYGY